jgi:hypothetical protein
MKSGVTGAGRIGLGRGPELAGNWGSELGPDLVENWRNAPDTLKGSLSAEPGRRPKDTLRRCLEARRVVGRKGPAPTVLEGTGPVARAFI